MTPHEALADGRLRDAVALQEAAINETPNDPAARRLLVDLLAFDGRIDDARKHLARIRTDEPEWVEVERELRGLLRAEQMRSVKCVRPVIYPHPPPKHARRRWLAIKELLREMPRTAVRCIDAAESVTPHLRGFLDGQEFEGLHDADDRFASVLEAFVRGKYVWFAWEGLRKVTLAPAAVLLDQLYRPTTITLKDGTVLKTHLPLVYPRSHISGGVFGLGTETDHICPDDGPTRCVGGKLLLVGEGAEVPLRECRMIEIR